MHQGRIVFAQLMDYLPKGEFRRCVKRYGGDRYVKRFSCWSQFLSMAFAQLTTEKVFAISKHAWALVRYAALCRMKTPYAHRWSMQISLRCSLNTRIDSTGMMPLPWNLMRLSTHWTQQRMTYVWNCFHGPRSVNAKTLSNSTSYWLWRSISLMNSFLKLARSISSIVAIWTLSACIGFISSMRALSCVQKQTCSIAGCIHVVSIDQQDFAAIRSFGSPVRYYPSIIRRNSAW